MFAVIRTGGKQYRVSAGDELTVEKLSAEAGETVAFDEVLMLGGEQASVGTPLVEGAAVKAEVLEQMRGPKVLTFKKRRRKHGSKRIKGHRQHLTRLRVTEIVGGGEGKKTAAKPKAKKTDEAAPETTSGAAPDAAGAAE